MRAFSRSPFCNARVPRIAWTTAGAVPRARALSSGACAAPARPGCLLLSSGQDGQGLRIVGLVGQGTRQQFQPLGKAVLALFRNGLVPGKVHARQGIVKSFGVGGSQARLKDANGFGIILPQDFGQGPL